MSIHNTNKFYEDKGRVEAQNENLKGQLSSLQKKVVGSKHELSFASKVKWSLIGSLMLLLSFFVGYFWYSSFGSFDFTLQNIIFIWFTSIVAVYALLYVLDEFFEIRL